MVTYADRPWVKSYDEGIPASLEPYPEIGLHDFLRKSAKEFPDNTVLVTTVKLPLVGRVTSALTYKELDRASDALAYAMMDMGLKKGDRVAIVMANITAFAITYYAILKAGGVVAATNPTYPPARMAYQINDCDAEFVVCMSLFYDLIKKIQPDTKLKHVIVTVVKEYFPPLAKLMFSLAVEKQTGHHVESLLEGDHWLQDLLKMYDGQVPDVEVVPEDIALFQYTGGTTGVSKGARATHSALVANMVQLGAWMKPREVTGGVEVSLGALPLFHVYGIVAILSRAVSLGSQIILVPNARDIDDVVDIIHVHKPTTFAGVPQLFNAISNHPRVVSGEASLKSITYSVSGSAPLPRAVQVQFEPLTNSRLGEGFGMSEAPTGTHAYPTLGEIRPGSIGLPLPDFDMRIVNLDDGVSDMPIGEVGELVISGPNLMKDYHRMPTETANALREKEGKIWLHTGDIARMDDDGYFYIVDRKKDMVLIGGFNVYPAQIEDRLKDHPAVLEVGVAGVPHPEREGQETVKAWVVFKPGQSATEEELKEHCSKYLAPYEVPRRYSFVEELPKSAVGKTLRRELVRLEKEEAEEKEKG
jgi:long-chain acyl-CoA synthetase